MSEGGLERPQSSLNHNNRYSPDPPIVDVCLSLFIITVGSPHSLEAMPFIKALCPAVAFERPEVKSPRAFDFRSFYKGCAKALIGPIGVDIQLFKPIPV